MYDVAVIGAGIFGSLITRALKKAGMSVVTIDAGLPSSGSRPAACLMKPSWFSSLGRETYEPALKKIDELVGVSEIAFKLLPTKAQATVYWADPAKVLLGVLDVDVVIGRVKQIVSTTIGYQLDLQDDDAISAKRVVIAAGVWTPLLSEVQVTGMAGTAWLWANEHIDQPLIQPWAPFKQIVAFNRGDGLWVGDGTSIKRWNDNYRLGSKIRCMGAVKKSLSKKADEPRVLFGYRPYVSRTDGKPCLLQQTRPGLWVATGGAKNGTLAAGWAADQLVKALM